MSRPAKKQDTECDIINATMQGQQYAIADRERREALRVLEKMKVLERKFGRLAAEGQATRTTSDEMNGTRVSYSRNLSTSI